MSGGGLLLPSVGKQAQLVSEPMSSKSVKSANSNKSPKTVISNGGAEDGNMFLLTKEEELAKVHKIAALSTMDKEHEATRFSLHNLSLRAGNEKQRRKAQQGCLKKMKQCALSMNPRSVDPVGVRALRISRVGPREFQNLCRRCLNLPFNDSELSEIVFKYGDNNGYIDGQRFMVTLLKMGKTAKTERLQGESKANREVTERLARISNTRTQKLMASKLFYVDYAFNDEDTASVINKLSEWAFRYQVCGVRTLGAGGLNGFIQTRMTPTELRDQVQRAFDYSLQSKELGALVVHMLNYEYECLQAAHASAPIPSTYHLIERKRKKQRAKSVPYQATRPAMSSSGSYSNFDEFSSSSSMIDDSTVESTGLSDISVSEVDQWERKAALYQHACLKRTLEEKGEIVMNAASFVAVMRIAGLQKEEEIRRGRVMKQATYEARVKEKSDADMLEANFDNLPRSTLIQPHKKSTRLLSSASYHGSFNSSQTTASSLNHEPPFQTTSSFTSVIGSSKQPFSNGSIGGSDESYFAEESLLKQALNKIATQAQLYSRRSLSSAGLRPLLGSGMKFSEFQFVLNKTLDIKLTLAEIEALAGYLVRNKTQRRASVLSADVGDVDHNGKIDPSDFITLFFVMRSKKVTQQGMLPNCEFKLEMGANHDRTLDGDRFSQSNSLRTSSLHSLQSTANRPRTTSTIASSSSTLRTTMS